MSRRRALAELRGGTDQTRVVIAQAAGDDDDLLDLVAAFNAKSYVAFGRVLERLKERLDG